MIRVAVFLVALLVCVPLAQADPPDPTALAAWATCVESADGRFARVTKVHGPSIGREPVVERIASDTGACANPRSATIEHWRGSVFVPGISVDRLLASLQGELPRQDDVLAARFLARSPDRVRVYLRIVRKKIISVVFDTEHEMVFERRSPQVAVARSEMTHVAEAARADDRGFLWRLNAYSVYEQTADGVLVTMESFTLSRSIPTLVKPIVGPLIDSIGRESMRNTLEGIRNRFP